MAGYPLTIIYLKSKSIMTDKTIKISKESVNKFNHDKNVVDMSYKELCENCPECPINNGADLNAQFMLESLFDSETYVKNKIGNSYIALGFINGIPVRCKYELGTNSLWVIAVLPKKECDYTSLDEILPKRLSDDEVFAKVTYFNSGYWYANFFYYPKD